MELHPLLRHGLRLALLALVAASVAAWATRTLRDGTPDSGPSATALPADGVAVVNFHGSLRCTTCVQIGALSRATVERDFGAARADGRVAWVELDFDVPPNAHYRDDYDIVASTVVVIARSGGRDVGWERLDEVWELYDDEAAFRDRLGRAVEGRLAELGR